MSQPRVNLVIGLALVGLGVLFLAQEVFDWQPLEWMWPLIVIAVGGLFFLGMALGGKSAGALAIPGSIFSVIGLMLFTFNLTDHWEAWAYGWGLIVAAVGLGLFIWGWWSGLPNLRRSGLSLLQLGVVLFLAFGAFFELLIFGSFQAASWFWPVVLIALGLWLLMTRAGLLGGPRRHEPPAPPAAEATVEGSARPAEDR